MGKYSWRCQKAGGNHKSVQTKLPAALKRITAVHHGALDDTLHQPKTRQGFAGIARCFRQDSKKKKKGENHAAVQPRAHTCAARCRVHGHHSRRKVQTAPWENEQQQVPTPLELDGYLTMNFLRGRPRVWRCPVSNHGAGRSNWIFLVFTGFSWKTTFSVQRSQIWTVWENGQMAVRWKFGGEEEKKNISEMLEACKWFSVWGAKQR